MNNNQLLMLMLYFPWPFDRYGMTVCAERTAVFRAVSEGVLSFRAIVITTDITDGVVFPCGKFWCTCLVNTISSFSFLCTRKIDMWFMEYGFDKIDNDANMCTQELAGRSCRNLATSMFIACNPMGR